MRTTLHRDDAIRVVRDARGARAYVNNVEVHEEEARQVCRMVDAWLQEAPTEDLMRGCEEPPRRER